MATETQRTRFWLDTGSSVAVFNNTEVDALFVEAAETYTDTTTMTAYTRVLGIQRLLANAAKLTDYSQNQSSEKQSQVFAHLQSLLGFWQNETTRLDSEASSNGAARFAGMRRSPKRIKEYPGGI